MAATIEQLNSEIEQYKTQMQYIDQVQNLLHDHLDITTNLIGKRKIDALHEEEEKEDLELNKLDFDVFGQSLKEAKNKQAIAAKTTTRKRIPDDQESTNQQKSNETKSHDQMVSQNTISEEQINALKELIHKQNQGGIVNNKVIYIYIDIVNTSINLFLIELSEIKINEQINDNRFMGPDENI